MSLRRLTRTRIGITISLGLIIFGIVALVPRSDPARPTPTSLTGGAPDHGVADLAAHKETGQVVAAEHTAAQQVADQFVIACDTTDPAQPEGDVTTEAALAPTLARPHDVVEPALWRSQGRATTVALDAPGQVVSERGGTVSVIVTGTMTVTTDAAAPQLVPLVERITLHSLQSNGAAPPHSTSERGGLGWQVVGVAVGA